MTTVIDYGRNLFRERLRRLEAKVDHASLITKQRVEKIPISLRARHWLRKLMFVPWTKQVSVDKLLLGYQCQFSGSHFAELTKDLMWTSRRVADGPHAQLLRLALSKESSRLTDREILESPYGTFVRRCVAARGQFFGASEPQEIVHFARAFIARSHGESQSHTFPGQSSDGIPITVARISHSDYYQLVDGHHRAAAAAVADIKNVRVRTRWVPAITAMQGLVTSMSWINGRRELYQPLPAPEISTAWSTVRQCSDRLEKITNFLRAEDLLPPVTKSYLDVASCYGWFVGAMGDLGYECQGIELDPLARPLGEAAYGLQQGQVTVGNCIDVMQSASRQWDVVSCFSLIHHFVLGNAGATPAQLLELLDRITGKVLFLDSGESHERWHHKTMPNWNAEKIRAFLEANTQFARVIDLGADADAVPPYEDNYGRHLFACIRH